MPVPDVVVVAPVLPADVRNQLRAVAESGRLQAAVCGASYHSCGWVAKAVRRLSGRMFSRTSNRRIDDIPIDQFHPFLAPETVSTLAGMARLRQPGPRSADWVSRAIDRRGASFVSQRTCAVLAREDACLETFRAADRAQGVKVYDLPIPFYRVVHQAIENETAQFPGVTLGFQRGQEFHPTRMKRKEAELAAADRVLVASHFVRRSVVDQGFPIARVSVIPYGCEAGQSLRPFADRKPVVLFVGRVSVLKGIPRLLRVWKKIGGYRTHTLRLIGKKMLSDRFLDEYSGTYEYLPPMPRSELWAHFSAAQLFVFPSACDGFGLVLNEALSCGTPVLASSNTGAPGFVTEGVQGVTYPHGDDEALASHLDRLLSAPARLAEMGIQAYQFAQRWTWVEYRSSVRALINQLVPPQAT